MKSSPRPLVALLAAVVLASLSVGTAGSAEAAKAHHGSHQAAKKAGHRASATGLAGADRASISAAYRATLGGAAAATTAGWTGSVAGCDAGTSSATSQAATVAAVNFARSLNGLEPVRLSASLSARAQRTALLMEANATIDHDPATTWACYDATAGADAGRSLLSYSGGEMTVGEAVTQYLADPGTTNTAAGHRRWLLDPTAREVGTGMTATKNAYYVMGRHDAARTNPEWTSWPAAGSFPSQLEPAGRWSLSSGRSTADFSRARVTVTDLATGAQLPVTVAPTVGDIAAPTLVFDVQGVSATGTYRVAVTGIAGARATQRRYQVAMFAA